MKGQSRAVGSEHSGRVSAVLWATLALASLGATHGAPTVWFFVFCGGILIAGGCIMAAAGRAVIRRIRTGRSAALILAVPNLAVVPFGTALGIYTFWTLLNDDARREFGRPMRGGR